MSGSRPHSGKLLSDKVFLLFLLTERTASFYERCLYPVRLAVAPVFSSRVASVASDPFRFDSKQSLVHLQAVHQTGPFIEASDNSRDGGENRILRGLGY